MAEEGAEYFQKDMSNAWSYSRYCGRQYRVMAEGGGAASSQQDGSREDKLIVGMWNARSMGPKMDEIRWLIRTFGFDVLVIVESWLDRVLSKDISIPGYHEPLNYPRLLGTPGYGGILIYLRKTLQHSKGEIYEHETHHIQYVVINITLPDQHDRLVLVAVYNPKGHTTLLYRLLGSCLTSLRTTEKNVMVLGDFNIDLNPIKVTNCRQNRRKLRDPHQLDEHIQSATHVGVRAGVPYATHIDHIYYSRNRRLSVTYSGVILRTCSDHYPIFCVLAEKSDQESDQESDQDSDQDSGSRSQSMFGDWLKWLKSENVVELSPQLTSELKNAKKPIGSKPVGSISCLYRKCFSVKISNQEELEQHYSQHHPVCPLPCNKILESVGSLAKHQEKCKHFKSTLFKCHYAKCRAVTVGSPEELKKHYKEKHAICPIPCNDILFNKASLAKHQEKCEKFLAVNSPLN